MTVSTTASEVTFLGNDVATVFPLGFIVLDEADLIVSIQRVNNTISPRILNVHYTVSNLNNPSGATVTLNPALATGEKLLVARKTPRTQEAQLLPQAGFSPKAVEDALDRMALIVQEAGSGIDRSMKVPVGETVLDLPSLAARAGKLLGFNEGGNPIAAEAIAQALVSEFWQNVLLQTTISGSRSELFAALYNRQDNTIDFNNVATLSAATQNGFHTTGATSVGLPSFEDGVGGHMLVLNYAPNLDLGFQMYFSPSGRLYRRGRVGASFTAWRMVNMGVLLSAALSSQAFVEFDLRPFDPYCYGYEVEFIRCKPASDNVFPQIQFGINGVSPVTTGVYTYSNFTYASGPGSADAAAGQTSLRLSNTALGNDSFEFGFSGKLRIEEGVVISGQTMTQFEGSGFNTAQSQFGLIGNGHFQGGNAINYLRFFFSSGNLGSGTILVRGLSI